VGEREREMETGDGDGLLARMVRRSSSSREMWMDLTGGDSDSEEGERGGAAAAAVLTRANGRTGERRARGRWRRSTFSLSYDIDGGLKSSLSKRGWKNVDDDDDDGREMERAPLLKRGDADRMGEVENNRGTRASPHSMQRTMGQRWGEDGRSTRVVSGGL
jgi:hypothetical protein